MPIRSAADLLGHCTAIASPAFEYGPSAEPSLCGVSNIWTQPLSGGPPRQLTQFTSGRIAQFEWSTGRNLIYTRRTINNDVVLVRHGR